MASIQNLRKSIKNDVKICNSSAIALMVNKTYSNLSKKQFLHFSLIFPGFHSVRNVYYKNCLHAILSNRIVLT